MLSVLADHQIPLEHMPSSIDSMTVIVDTEHLKGIEEQIRTEIIKAVQPDSMDVEENIALIAVVGRGMCRTRGVAARIFAALAHARINVRMIDQGSSELNVIVAVICSSTLSQNKRSLFPSKNRKSPAPEWYGGFFAGM